MSVTGESTYLRGIITAGRWLAKSAIILIIPAVVIPASTGVAFAYCEGEVAPPAQYQYAGKYSSAAWLGASGDISTTSETTGDDQTNHILNYVDMSDVQGASSCFDPSEGQCWIQTGNSIGHTEDQNFPNQPQCLSSTVGAYMEENDVKSYQCDQYTSAQLPLAQTDFYEVFSTGEVNSMNDALVDAYVYNGNGYYLTGQAYIPNDAESKIFAYTEFSENSNTSCPSLNSPEYFGDGSFSLEQYSSSYQWQYWTTSLQTIDGPLGTTPDPINSVDNFEVFG